MQLTNHSVTAVSITRLVYLVTLDINDPDVTWVFRMPQIWTCVELNVAVICGCLPQLRPLLQLITTGSIHGSSAASGKGSDYTGGSSMREPKPLPSPSTVHTNPVSVSGEDTRPLVAQPASKGKGYVELQNMEKGEANQEVQPQGAGAGAWDVHVRTDWNVSSNSPRQATRV